jgi:hypothetical protein
MSETFDFDVVLAEAQHRVFNFKLGGQELSMLHARDIDYQIIASGIGTSAEAIDNAFKAAMSSEVYEALRAARPGMEAVTALFTAWFAHAGIDLGKSMDSEDSSEITETPSTPASEPTTPASTSASSPRASSRSGKRSSSSSISRRNPRSA